MEKLNLKKIIGLSAIGAGVLAMSGCAGTYTEPTNEQLQKDGQFFELERPDGSKMDCWSYSASGSSGYAGYSWLTVTCDWDGQQINEPITTQTTLPSGEGL